MIELLIFNSLFIFGVFASMGEGMIFERIGFLIRGKVDIDNPPHHSVKYSKYQFPAWIKKPLGTCPVCMASVYGTPVFWSAYYLNYINYDFIIIVYICYVFALSGLNYLILAYMPE